MILVGMGVAIALVWLTVEALYIDAQRTNLLAQAQLVAAALRSDAPVAESSEAYSQATNVLPGIHTRVIDPRGAVLIDLGEPEGTLEASGLILPELAQNTAGQVTAEELANRPEIAQARLGQPATAIRRVEVAGGKRVLYAAAPVLSADGSVVQIVYLATPLPDTQWSALPVARRWQLGGDAAHLSPASHSGGDVAGSPDISPVRDPGAGGAGGQRGGPGARQCQKTRGLLSWRPLAGHSMG